MIDKVSTKECYLCKGCSNICPVNAIDFSIEEKGFFYPRINELKCINCNLCEKVCPVLNKLSPPKDDYPITYAVRSKNVDIRLNSTSGGVFYELGMYILSQGGSVCGAIFDDEFQVMHIITEQKSLLRKMCGSKYVQSNINFVYKEIKKLLDSGKMVLFCGCPCQTAALKLYLNESYINLFLIDFICHGIPSQTFFDSYIKTIEKKYNSKVQRIEFRNKDKGWHRSCVKISFKNRKIYNELIHVDAYMRAFLGGTIMKESCYNCHMKNFLSGSDITLGDFWGAEVYLSNIDDNTGISAVFVNTEKGKKLLSLLDLEKINIKKEQVIKYNQNILQSTKPSKIRKEFYNSCEMNGVGETIIKYFHESKINKIKRTSKYTLRCINNKIRGKDKPLY